MLKKGLVFGLIILAASSLIYSTTSYTRAEIRNQANLRITNSESALILVPKETSINIQELITNKKIINATGIMNNLSTQIYNTVIAFRNNQGTYDESY